jgi:hypothetical protein
MKRDRLTTSGRQPIEFARNAGSNEASWRSGYAEDCKSLHPGSIPGEASILKLQRVGAGAAVRSN